MASSLPAILVVCGNDEERGPAGGAGTPDTNERIFTVNCPVPVLAPNTFTG